MMDRSECEGDDATLENVNDYKLQFIKKTRTIQPYKKTLEEEPFTILPCRWMKSKLFTIKSSAPFVAFYDTEVKGTEKQTNGAILNQWEISENGTKSLNDDPFYKLLYDLIILREENFKFVEILYFVIRLDFHLR